MNIQLGDIARVVGLPNSEWQHSRGIVVGIMEGANSEKEYALSFGRDKRWFLSRHLAKSIPDRLVRFFRAEVHDCFKQLNVDAVASLSGDYDELVELLMESHGLGQRRALAEVELFFRVFQERVECATTSTTNDDKFNPRAAAA